MNKIKKINYYRRENEILTEINSRISQKEKYSIKTGIINELNWLLLHKKISFKKYKTIYRKFFFYSFYKRETNFFFYNKTGIAFNSPDSQKKFLKNWILKNCTKIVKLTNK